MKATKEYIRKLLEDLQTGKSPQLEELQDQSADQALFDDWIEDDEDRVAEWEQLDAIAAMLAGSLEASMQKVKQDYLALQTHYGRKIAWQIYKEKAKRLLPREAAFAELVEKGYNALRLQRFGKKGKASEPTQPELIAWLMEQRKATDITTRRQLDRHKPALIAKGVLPQSWSKKNR
jgi:hypothetical protein